MVIVGERGYAWSGGTIQCDRVGHLGVLRSVWLYRALTSASTALITSATPPDVRGFAALTPLNTMHTPLNGPLLVHVYAPPRHVPGFAALGACAAENSREIFPH